MRIKLLIIFASLLTLVFAVNVGVASADHPGGTEWTCDEAQNGGGCAPGDRNPIGPAADNALAPVGRNISDQGLLKAFGEVRGEPFTIGNGPADFGITHNPLCPFHPVEETP